MICNQLTKIGIPERALLHGSGMHELKCRSDLSTQELDFIHLGKDASIDDMLNGGAGFPFARFAHVAMVPFESGCIIERNDIRTMLVWQGDRELCLRDRRNGVES